MTIVDSERTQTMLVEEYLGRLHAAAWALAPQRREELVAEVREHIDDALRAEQDAGHRGQVVVRNVLERLGPPEDIVRAESEGLPYAAAGPPPVVNPWGTVEILAVVLLSIGSFVLPIIGPTIGVVLVWISNQWTTPQKLVGTVLALLPALSVVLLLAVSAGGGGGAL